MSSVQDHRRLLGHTVWSIRKKAGMTQEDLAGKSGLSTVFISRVERGVESPSVDSLVKIAGALQVKVADLVAEK